MNRLFKLLCLFSISFLINTVDIYANNKSDITVVYNTKELDFGEKSIINENGTVYIPLRVFSEQLHYTVQWNETEKYARIFDNLNDIYLYTNGNVRINGEKTTSTYKPLIINGVTYIPLRFVSENLDININYDSSKKIVNMSGRDIYDIVGHSLEVYTKKGRNTVTKINTEDLGVPQIYYVDRTKYSDIVTTSYLYSGSITVEENNQIYIKEGKMIYNTNIRSDVTAFKVMDRGVRYYDDRVAFVTEDKEKDYLIKIFDDKKGTLIKTINSTKDYKSVLNIQGVGNDFIVVNMLEDDNVTNEGNPVGKVYMTTVIDLESGKTTPIYRQLKNPDEYLYIAINSAMYIMSGTVPTDGIYFDNRVDGMLNFKCYSINNNVTSYQYVIDK